MIIVFYYHAAINTLVGGVTIRSKVIPEASPDAVTVLSCPLLRENKLVIILVVAYYAHWQAPDRLEKAPLQESL